MAPTDITPIHVPYPEAPDLELKIIADGCYIDIKPEAANDWVSGTYQDPSGQRSPRITQDGGTLTIDHARTTTNVVGELTAGTPRFDLVLGTGQPYALTIQAAAIESYAELAGLPITRLVINQRAGQSRISFGQANPQPAELLHISAQGATIETRNLANANAAAISLDGDATRYLVDFGGELQRNTHAAVSARASSMEITVPTSTAARISATSMLGDLDVGDGFRQQGGAFWTQTAASADHPLLTIDASVEAGQLKLRVQKDAASHT